MGLLKIAAAGILSLPALVVSLLTAPLIALLSLPSLALLCFQTNEAPKAKDDNGAVPTKEHAIISGGSSGIGFSIAQDCVERGMTKVTILARNETKLQAAVQKLKKINSHSEIFYKSVDVSNAASLETVAKEVCGDNTNNKATTKYYLFCCAGFAYPNYFEHNSAQIFSNSTNTNQLGTIFTVHAFLPFLKYGTIVFTSSMAGQIGIYGLTAYCPTKFALRGFAEALHAELADQPYLNVQVAFPPDTDTPGFEVEQETKPKETRMISEQGGLSKPETIANTMVNAALADNPAFLVYFTLEGWMVAGLTAGMGPVSTLPDAVTQVALGGLFRFVSLFYLNDWWRIIRQCAQERLDKGEEKPRPAGVVATSKSDKPADKSD